MKSFLNTFTGLIIIAAFQFLWSCKEHKVGSDYIFENADYIGTKKCASCHQQEYDLYNNSDHDMAMKHADSTTVLGDFNNLTFRHFSIKSKFYKKDEKYFVFTEGRNGVMQEFRIKYTFGYYPLQQYLVEFDDGRIQCLPLCWDTRPESEGGQKWFHIYGKEKIEHNNIFHWTRVNQNWNYMCADCHSTNLKKNYDPIKNEYATTWSEINVSCEACHGPGSFHKKWGDAKQSGEEVNYQNKGLTKNISNTNSRQWIMNYSTGIAELIGEHNDEQIETCAPCHSHRSKIDDDIKPSEPFLDNYIPSLLYDNLYFDDGQIKEEVYVYGSFLQSKMYLAGVVCSDCHQSHSTKVFSKGDELCFTCHLPDKFKDISHHHHNKNSEGARCVNCHMPSRTYMQVDARRDHSFRIPRPDLSEKIGVPNACSQCHKDKSTDWATDTFINWYGEKDEAHFGEIFHSARRSDPESYIQLKDLIEDENLPAIIRATAISLLNYYPDKNSSDIFQEFTQYPDDLIRLAAVSVAGSLPSSDKLFLMENLSDSLKSIAVTAAQNLADILVENLTFKQKEILENGFNSFLQSQSLTGDHHTAQINLGNFFTAKGEFYNAEQAYNKAIELEQLFPPSYVNLADLYRIIGNEGKSKKVLLKGLEYLPEDASLNFALALLEIRNGNKSEAIKLLKKAVINDPDNAQYRYIYEIALKNDTHQK